MENEDLEIIILEDDKGGQIKTRMIDSFFYEGKEYAFLEAIPENEEEDPCAGCANKDCESCDAADNIDVFVMEIRPLENDMEELVPVDDEMAEELLEFYENASFNDEEEYEFEDAEDEDGDEE